MTSASEALGTLSSIPRDQEGPVFNAPWEAEVFALTLTLHEQGTFEWSEWANQLSSEIKKARAAGDPDLGDTYYRHWLAALESILVAKGITRREQLTGLYQSWDQAARRTPHGQPIELDT